MLLGGESVDVTQTADGVILKLRAQGKDEVDRVVVLTAAK
jgi:hypothetical protein